MLDLKKEKEIEDEYNRIQAGAEISEAETLEYLNEGVWDENMGSEELNIETELTAEEEDYMIESGLERWRGLDEEE